MQTRMAMVVEEGDADSTGARRHVEHTCQGRNPLFIARLLVPWLLGGSSALAPRKVHGDDGPGEGKGSDDATGYEERLQAEGADVRDEGDVGIGLARIARGALR